MRSGNIYDCCSFDDFTFSSNMWITDCSGTNKNFRGSLDPCLEPVSHSGSCITFNQYALNNTRLQGYSLSVTASPTRVHERGARHVFRLNHNTALPSALKRGTQISTFPTIKSMPLHLRVCVCVCACECMYVAQCYINIYWHLMS